MSANCPIRMPQALQSLSLFNFEIYWPFFNAILIQVWFTSHSGLIQVLFRSDSGLDINKDQIGLKCCELSHFVISDTGSPCLINFTSSGDYFIWYNCFRVGRSPFPQYHRHDWVRRIGTPGRKLKVGTFLEQKWLKCLQIVPFECPGNCNPSHYSILIVIDLPWMQFWFRSDSGLKYR